MILENFDVTYSRMAGVISTWCPVKFRFIVISFFNGRLYKPATRPWRCLFLHGAIQAVWLNPGTLALILEVLWGVRAMRRCGQPDQSQKWFFFLLASIVTCANSPVGSACPRDTLQWSAEPP